MPLKGQLKLSFKTLWDLFTWSYKYLENKNFYDFASLSLTSYMVDVKHT